jgi:hypothetical protein
MKELNPGFDVATVDPLANASGCLTQLIAVKYSAAADSKPDFAHLEGLKKLLKAQDRIKDEIKDGQTLSSGDRDIWRQMKIGK